MVWPFSSWWVWPNVGPVRRGRRTPWCIAPPSLTATYLPSEPAQVWSVLSVATPVEHERPPEAHGKSPNENQGGRETQMHSSSEGGGFSPTPKEKHPTLELKSASDGELAPEPLGSPPPVKVSQAVGKCCEDRNCGAFRGRSRRLQRKRHLPSQPGNSSEVEADEMMVGPSPSREAAPRSRDQVEVVKMTAKGNVKDRGVALALSGLVAAISALFLAGGALLVHQRCSNAAV
ncbi:unnamed protein product [Lepidochelys kempii]